MTFWLHRIHHDRYARRCDGIHTFSFSTCEALQQRCIIFAAFVWYIMKQLFCDGLLISLLYIFLFILPDSPNITTLHDVCAIHWRYHEYTGGIRLLIRRSSLIKSLYLCGNSGVLNIPCVLMISPTLITVCPRCTHGILKVYWTSHGVFMISVKLVSTEN